MLISLFKVPSQVYEQCFFALKLARFQVNICIVLEMNI